MADGLDIQITYRTILTVARKIGHITYSDLAERHGKKINDVHRPLIAQLDELLRICFRNGWPAMPVIVVATDTEELKGERLTVFAEKAKKVGYDVKNEKEFADQQKKKLIEWAPHAPRILEVEEPLDESSDDSTSRDELNYWVVEAYRRGGSRKDRFLEEGIWESDGYGMSDEEVKRIRAGDLLIMKSNFTRRDNLPFENNGKLVKVMTIKATGKVTKPTIDGRKIEVDWKPLPDPRDWYFFVYLRSIQRMNTRNKNARMLIKFAFEGEKQNLVYWLNCDWIRKKGYGTTKAPLFSMSNDTEEAPDEESGTMPYGIRDIVNDGCFVQEEDISNALSQLKSKKNLILQGPPGTGKTWLAKRLASALIGTRSKGPMCNQIRRIQFHPSLSYEDFVRGWRPNSGGKLELADGAFLKVVNIAHSNSNNDYVIIIDEINRGNTAQIFGEMLTLIENDKRNAGEAIEIAYPKADDERIYVPVNVHIIGTMNIADRSLALVDLALRRRFAFVSLEPVLDDRWVEWCVGNANFNRELVSEVGNALRSLNNQITNDRSLGSQYRIGHSYVTPPADGDVGDDREWFRQAIVFGIGPLLHEYWFENPDTAQEHVDKLLESIQ